MPSMFETLGGKKDKLAIPVTDAEMAELESKRLAQLALEEELAASLATKDINGNPIAAPTSAEGSFNVAEVIALAKGSMDFLAGLVAPLAFTFCFPPVFLSVWQWLLAYVNKPRTFPQLALGLPRGFAKTTVMKIFVMYCILFTNRRFILVISNTATLAENFISDITDMLDEPNIKAVFGDWRLGIERDTLQMKKFGFRGRNLILAGIGAGTSLRGLNIKNTRPDVMIFDDIQSREQADSEVLSDNLERWMYGTAMKAKNPTGCMFIFLANMYPTPYSILRKLKTNPNLTKFIAGGILADGTSLWEELQPITQLIKEFENDLASGHPEIFFSEVLNDPDVNINRAIDINKIPLYPFSEDDIPIGNFIVIDPSNDKVKSDAVSIGYFEVIEAKPVLMEVIDASLSPGDTIRSALTLALRKNCKLIAVEANAYQYSLLYWFDFFCQQLGISGLHCVDIYSGNMSKNSRILVMFKELLAGETVIHPKARAFTDGQLTTFNSMKTTNTDGILDLLTYAPKVMAQYGQFIQSDNIIDEMNTNSITIPENNSPF